MAEKIKPALTAEEWKRPTDETIDGYIDLDLGVVDVRLRGVRDTDDELRDTQLLAALLLNGQPFGFTREDAENCREAAVRSLMDGFGEFEPIVIQLRSLADRIEALLPPETNQPE